MSVVTKSQVSCSAIWIPAAMASIMLLCLFVEDLSAHSTSELYDEIRSKDSATSVAAIQRASELARLKKLDVKETVGALIDAINSGDGDRVSASADTIGVIGPDAVAATDALIGNMVPGMSDSSGRLVWNVLSEALGKIGGPALPTLLTKLNEADETRFKGVCAAIHNMAADLDDQHVEMLVPAIANSLQKESGERLWSVAYAITDIGPRGVKLVPQLIKALDDEDMRASYTACQALANIGPPAKQAVPKLVELMHEGVVSERSHAALALAAIGPVDGVDTVGELIKMLDDPNAVAQERAIIGLGMIGPDAKAALPALEAKMQNKSFRSRSVTAFTVWQITGEAKPTLDELTECLDSPNYDLDAIEKLGLMGPAAEPVIPALIARFESGGDSVQTEICVCLAQIGIVNESVRRVLQLAVESADSELSIEAKNTRERLGIE